MSTFDGWPPAAFAWCEGLANTYTPLVSWLREHV